MTVSQVLIHIHTKYKNSIILPCGQMPRLLWPHSYMRHFAMSKYLQIWSFAMDNIWIYWCFLAKLMQDRLINNTQISLIVQIYIKLYICKYQSDFIMSFLPNLTFVITPTSWYMICYKRIIVSLFTVQLQ